MIAKDLDLSALTDIFEIIFDVESPSPAINRVLIEQKLDLVYQLEKTLSAIWSAVDGSLHPSTEDLNLLKKLQEMLSSLKHGMFELDHAFQKPNLFSGHTASIFSKRSLLNTRHRAGRR